MAATVNGHSLNRVMVVLGTQWGDEGKGKLVDLLSGSVDVVARCQGGNNAGHTVVSPEGVSYAFHLLPSGLVHEHVIGVLGNGVVIHLPDLFKEIENNEVKGLVGMTGKEGPPRLFLSTRAHLVFDLHQKVDALQEVMRTDSKTNLGTTKKGIGPAYSSKAGRSGLRVIDLVSGDFEATFGQKFRRLVKDHEASFSAHGLSVDVEQELHRYRKLAEQVKPMVTETVALMHKQLKEGKRVLVEGANASMLDIDFGTYPYVTSSNCSIGGVMTGLGLPPCRIGDVFGVVKAYTTRVGTGAFPTEQANEIGDFLQRVGHEFGVTTGRKRRCGWLDIPLLRYTNMINNYTAVAVTKLDILDDLDEIKIGVEYLKGGVALDHFPSSEEEFEGIHVEYITMPGWKTHINNCRKFEDLPANAQAYVNKIENLLKVPVGWIGVGQGRDAIITKQF